MISLTLTDAAKAALAKTISRITEYEALATVMWSEGGSKTSPEGVTTPLPPGWGVAFYRRDEMRQEHIQSIAGIDFIFVQGPISERLHGKTLDFTNGRFRVKGDGI